MCYCHYGENNILMSRDICFFTLHALLNAVIYCLQLNTRGVLGLIPREWIISHRCSWMAVYVFFCNAQSKSHSDPLDICTLSLFYQLPNCNLFTQHVVIYLSYEETPLVNCGPRSYFLYIAITCLLYLHYLLFCILLLLSTRYTHSFVYSKLVRLRTSS
jgi:hypothetical protein